MGGGGRNGFLARREGWMMIPGEGGNVDIQSRNRVNRVSQNQQNICLCLFVQCNMCR